MGIDYDANFGIGYEIDCSDEEILEDFEEDVEDYVDCQSSNEYFAFRTGDEISYSGISKIFICIRDPFKNGFDLSKSKIELDKEIERLKLDKHSEFGVVGGLRIW